MSYDELLEEEFDAVEIVETAPRGLRWIVRCQDCILTRNGWTSDPEDTENCFFNSVLDAATFYTVHCAQEKVASKFNLELNLLHARLRKHFDATECCEIMDSAEKAQSEKGVSRSRRGRKIAV